MEQINILLSGMLLVITIMIVILAVYSIRRRKVPGAMPFFFLCMITSLYTFGYGMELFSQTLDKVNFWSKFQYIGLPFIPAIWVILSISYSRVAYKYNNLFYFFLFLIPILTCLFRLTNTHLQYGTMRMVSNGYFLVLDFQKGPWYYLHFLYFFLCAGYSSFIYFKQYLKASGYLKQQSLIMAIASLAVISSLILNLFNIFPFKLDSGPFIVIFDYLIFTYGIFRYNMLHLIPLSRKIVFDKIHVGVLVFDMQFNIVDFNKAATEIFVELSKDVIGLNIKECLFRYKSFVDLLIFWQLNKANNELGKTITQVEDNFEFEILNDKKQCIYHYHVRLSELYKKEYLVGTTIMINDITKQYEMIKQLEYASRIDGLTGLFNRTYFFERMEYEIDRAARSEESLTIMLMDIDDFKKINDTWGHQAGDYILKTVSTIIAQNLRDIDLVGRYGGEEFIFCLPNTNLENAVLIADRLRYQIQETVIYWRENMIHISASFGVAGNRLSDHSIRDYDTLIRKADEAMYLSKRKGKNRVEAFT
ncbi:MAG: diguanylate cyclase [Dehalobacterium sp.]